MLEKTEIMTKSVIDSAEWKNAARSFARDHLVAKAQEWEMAGLLPESLHREAAKAGLTLVMAPEPFGPKLSYRNVGHIAEELSAGFFPFALALISHNYLAWAILGDGNEKLRDRYLPQMKAGEIQGVFSLTEPQSGSDVAAIQTAATRTSNGFLLNGEKAWILRAESADFFGVYAQTNPGSGPKGIAMFLVEADLPGIRRFSFDLFAGQAFGMGGFTLKDVEVPESALLIEPGQALKSALSAIDVARATVASMCCGLLRRGLEEALSTTTQRHAFGHAIGEFQGVQWMLADVATDLEASRALANVALEKLDNGEPASLYAAHAKKFASRACLKGLVDCMQVMGANGAKTESVSSRHLGYAKLSQYLDGATEIQNVVISRHLYES